MVTRSCKGTDVNFGNICNRGRNSVVIDVQMQNHRTLQIMDEKKVEKWVCETIQRKSRDKSAGSEVFLGECEIDGRTGMVDGCFLNGFGKNARSTEVGSDFGLELRFAARNVLP